MKISKGLLSKFWLEEYLGKDKRCFLCKNSGKITINSETRFCICPNGRALKKNNNVLG